MPPNAAFQGTLRDEAAQRPKLLNNLDDAHAAYYRAAVFGGPSLHFHLRALEAARARDLAWFAEASYPMLPCWD